MSKIEETVRQSTTEGQMGTRKRKRNWPVKALNLVLLGIHFSTCSRDFGSCRTGESAKTDANFTSEGMRQLSAYCPRLKAAHAKQRIGKRGAGADVR